MFTVSNSVKNIYRHRRKYIFIGTILLSVVLTASVLIGVYNYSKMSTEALKTKYAGVVKVSRDDSIPFDKADYEAFYNLDYVSQVEYKSYVMSSASMGLIRYGITEDHKRLMSPEDYEAAIKESPVVEAEIIVKGESHILSNLRPNHVYIMGYNYDVLNEDEKAKFVIESGRMYENDNECIITQNPLVDGEEWNMLGIGDKIKISKNTGVSKEYTVVGILKSADNLTEETKTRVLFTTFDSAANFGSATITESERQISSGPVNNPLDDREKPTLSIEQYEITVNLKSYEYLNAFINYAVVENGYYAVPFYHEYQSLLRLLSQTYMWSIIFIAIIAIILVFMTVFTTIFNLNSRKYEIAVLRSVGMKKGHLILSYLIENLTFVWGIAAVASVVSMLIEPIFINKVFAGVYSSLASEVSSILPSMTGLSFWMSNIGIVFGGMTVTVILSLVVICINIVRFEPLRIFGKQY